jgi:hypothetical protein
MKTTNTAAYAAVAARRFSGTALENIATLNANKRIEIETTTRAFIGIGIV